MRQRPLSLIIIDKRLSTLEKREDDLEAQEAQDIVTIAETTGTRVNGCEQQVRALSNRVTRLEAIVFKQWHTK